ncbi:MAG: helix-turn-helix domain-containing protein [Ruminococcus sp.]
MDVGTATQKRIIELCKINNITVNKLSIMCGITQSTLNNIVSGRNKSTTVSTVKKICDGINITIQDFFDSPLFENLEQEIK